MDQKRFIDIIVITVIVIILILVGLAVYFIVNQQTPLPTSVPLLTPTPTLSPSSTPVLKPNWTSYKEDGTCPSGYVDYGMPLQCVTPEYMEYCRTRPCPICLAGKTLIETPKGLLPVKDLQIGMLIWTIDKSGRRVHGVIKKTSRIPVPPTHQMVHLILSDGRQLLVSPGHPTADGRTIGELKLGDLYDGAFVVSVTSVPYGESATYDVLPSGETGFYWANGVLIGSTLYSK